MYWQSTELPLPQVRLKLLILEYQLIMLSLSVYLLTFRGFVQEDFVCVHIFKNQQKE